MGCNLPPFPKVGSRFCSQLLSACPSLRVDHWPQKSDVGWLTNRRTVTNLANSGISSLQEVLDDPVWPCSQGPFLGDSGAPVRAFNWGHFGPRFLSGVGDVPRCNISWPKYVSNIFKQFQTLGNQKWYCHQEWPVHGPLAHVFEDMKEVHRLISKGERWHPGVVACLWAHEITHICSFSISSI